MSGAKATSNLERPQESVGQPPALYKESGFLNTTITKIIIGVMAGVLTLMMVLALIFCIVGAVQHKQPRYFLLMLNLILSGAVTGLLIFWYFRGTLVSTMLWYVFVQCVFLFFQCVTTDVFAWYEASTVKPSPWGPIRPGLPCNATNACNSSNHSLFASVLQHFFNFSKNYTA